jgi:lipid II isoglutaminyl synthase (glutamine-hydrolysing)
VLNIFLIIFGKFVVFFSKIFNLGSGSTWPGHIALTLNPNFIKQILRINSIKIILIAGTNGKTTTGRLIQTIIGKSGKKVFQNASGANLLNGIASSLIFNSNLSGKIDNDFAIFEIDENTLPLILKEIPNPNYIILLNLFRDQLDRYGEVNTIANKWKKSLENIEENTVLILNADDPQIAYLGVNRKNVDYFGVNLKNPQNFIEHASDSTYCPKCNSKLAYKTINFSHLGNWRCTKCLLKYPDRVFTQAPFYPLLGTYNKYNTNAAVLLSTKIGLNKNIIHSALKTFTPAFGRQEIMKVNGKYVQILLSKNPTSLNECLRTTSEIGAKKLMLVLNDRVPDGKDVSWIWDVDFENFKTKFDQITVSGDRTYDMALRLKYAEYNNFNTEENLSSAIKNSLKNVLDNNILYILATYSAMLDCRKVLTGKKIL